MMIFFPHKSTESKRKAAVKIFRSIRQNKSIPSIPHLVDDETPKSILTRALNEMQDLGLIDNKGENWVFSDELPNNLRKIADAIESYMQPKSSDPKKMRLKSRAKHSQQAWGKATR